MQTFSSRQIANFSRIYASTPHLLDQFCTRPFSEKSIKKSQVNTKIDMLHGCHLFSEKDIIILTHIVSHIQEILIISVGLQILNLCHGIVFFQSLHNTIVFCKTQICHYTKTLKFLLQLKLIIAKISSLPCNSLS